MDVSIQDISKAMDPDDAGSLTDWLTPSVNHMYGYSTQHYFYSPTA